MKKDKGPKKVNYVLIPRDSEMGGPMYDLLDDIVRQHHQDLDNTDARIALAWNLSWQPDVDGRVTLGKCKKATDLDRELAPFDFVIMLRREFWQHLRVTDLQRRALLDHELCHAAIAFDNETGNPIVDERGRQVFRVRKHDLEEFSEIAGRYGCWKRDIEAFASALARGTHQQKLGLVDSRSDEDADLDATKLTMSIITPAGAEKVFEGTAGDMHRAAARVAEHLTKN